MLGKLDQTLTFASFELDNINLPFQSSLKYLGLFLFCDKYKPVVDMSSPHEPNLNNFTISRTIALLTIEKRVGEGLRKTKWQKKKNEKAQQFPLKRFESFKNKINYQWNLDTTKGQWTGKICSL